MLRKKVHRYWNKAMKANWQARICRKRKEGGGVRYKKYKLNEQDGPEPVHMLQKKGGGGEKGGATDHWSNFAAIWFISASTTKTSPSKNKHSRAEKHANIAYKKPVTPLWNKQQQTWFCSAFNEGNVWLILDETKQRALASGSCCLVISHVTSRHNARRSCEERFTRQWRHAPMRAWVTSAASRGGQAVRRRVELVRHENGLMVPRLIWLWPWQWDWHPLHSPGVTSRNVKKRTSKNEFETYMHLLKRLAKYHAWLDQTKFLGVFFYFCRSKKFIKCFEHPYMIRISGSSLRFYKVDNFISKDNLVIFWESNHVDCIEYQ